MSRRTFIASITGQPRAVDIHQIARDVSRLTGVSIGEIMGSNRQARIVVPRHEVMRRANAAGMTLGQIGLAMHRDHTSVLNGINRAKERLNIKEEVK